MITEMCNVNVPYICTQADVQSHSYIHIYNKETHTYNANTLRKTKTTSKQSKRNPRDFSCPSFVPLSSDCRRRGCCFQSVSSALDGCKFVCLFVLSGSCLREHVIVWMLCVISVVCCLLLWRDWIQKLVRSIRSRSIHIKRHPQL